MIHEKYVSYLFSYYYIKLGYGEMRIRTLLNFLGENGLHFRTQWGRFTLRTVLTDNKLIID